jgi:hypothetical protein
MFYGKGLISKISKHKRVSTLNPLRKVVILGVHFSEAVVRVWELVSKFVDVAIEPGAVFVAVVV